MKPINFSRAVLFLFPLSPFPSPYTYDLANITPFYLGVIFLDNPCVILMDVLFRPPRR